VSRYAGAEDAVPQMSSDLHQIGEVAERVGLSLRTVRYYEEQGLLVPATRTDGGFRLYAEEQIERLELIKQMKPLGFSVQEMGQLLHARDTLRDPHADLAQRDAASQRLHDFAAAAARRCAELTAQLVLAKQFAGNLRREAGVTTAAKRPS
jgi:DNA-binding transcriptional MerR regulator